MPSLIRFLRFGAAAAVSCFSAPSARVAPRQAVVAKKERRLIIILMAQLSSLTAWDPVSQIFLCVDNNRKNKRLVPRRASLLTYSVQVAWKFTHTTTRR